jgi:hypothetical protein
MAFDLIDLFAGMGIDLLPSTTAAEPSRGSSWMTSGSLTTGSRSSGRRVAGE